MNEQNLTKLKCFLKSLKRTYGNKIEELLYEAGMWIMKDNEGHMYVYDEETDEIIIIKESK